LGKSQLRKAIRQHTATKCIDISAQKKIQEFLVDTPEDDNDIIEIKEPPDVQDYVDFTELEQNEHQYDEPQHEQLKKRKRVDKGTQLKSTPSNMSKKDMRLLKNKTIT
jgi:hypothetical protein